MSATSDEVLYEVSEGIATLTLNRPDRLNTISGPMLDQLTQLLLKANADPEVKVILLTGKGRAFCAGLDLVSATQGTGIGGQTERVAVDLDLRNTPPTVLFALDKPSICAMNGSAAGYGMDVALGCDIRIMAEGAKMAAAFVKRGIVPESGGTWYLPRMIGWAKAAELIFTGRTLTAAESLEMGLANHVVPDDQVQAKARALAAEIAANAPL
ncbi:MAG TPA: enoyl-CoA hydratase/isomerase family protein, partial [Phenylobacterium sp.]|nr:enoyl-CoA hydratase/isomerase family protein [Phenylobacterium sp.]